MGRKIAYQDDQDKKFCQIELDNGERILISVAQSGVKIFKLFFGIIPIKTIYQADLKTAVDLFMETEEWGRPILLDKIVTRLIDCPSIDDVLERLRSSF
ncbi:MAG: hypothetical protein G01um10143_518 [Parcubacteria group bacterium Gr01-1014_3]|nr:MAG: hypothetical protein G01um10143_518 [Parcubacteria group bacterium Gr01-1014_3]